MIIYVYNKCSTCQKALRFLAQKNVKFTCKEITQEPPSLEELQQMLQYMDLKKLFNTSGQLYRELQLSEKLKEMTLMQSLTLLTQHGMLVKRPFLIADNFGLTGFCEVKWSERF
jgi:arsenate reductase (glutaredoxin)